MSLKNVTSTETNVSEIEFNLDKEAFEAAQQRAYKKNVGKLNVPGFRKGKAPKSIIEKMYGKSFFYEEAINELIPEAYDAALKESKLDVVSYPEFDIVSIDDADGVVMKAKVYTRPVATISNYKGLTATKEIAKVTDADIDDEINRVKERNARLVEVTDRAAKDGDTVVFDYSGSVDGVKFEGGTAEKQTLVLGSGQFIPGFEEQIVGKSIGEEFDVNVTFPTEYHAPELAGKEAVFACKLHEIKYNEYPEIDDEFAKDVSEFDTLAEYKADIKAKMEDRNAKNAENAVEEQLIDGLLANLTVELPAPMIDMEVDNEMRNYESRLAQQGLRIDDYFKYTGMTIDSMKEQFKPQAERQVRTRLALEAVAELENIQVTEADLEEDYKTLADMYKLEVEKIKDTIAAEDLSKDVKVRKAVECVKANAVISEKEATKEEKANEAKPKRTRKPKAESAE